MMIGKLRRAMQEDEAGQALVLGAMVMLVLALSVFVTVQLGNGIHERMRVQDAADSVAFSTAAAVARSYNFFSWVNRTMITQYVSAMAIQGVVSLVDGVTAWIGMMGDLFEDLAVIVCAIKLVLTLVFGIGQILNIIEKPLQIAAKFCDKLAKGLRKVSDGLDAIVAPAVKFISLLNHWGMYGAQMIMKWSTTTVLAAEFVGNFQAQMMKDIAGDNINTNSVGTVNKGAMSVLNPASYLSSFDKDSGDLDWGGTYPAKLDWNDGQQRAERLMAELTNASRTGTEGEGITWETNSGFSPKDLLPGTIGAILSFITGEVKNASRATGVMNSEQFSEEKANPAFDPAKIADKIKKAGNPISKGKEILKMFGQKPVSDGRPNFIWSNGEDTSLMTRGTALSSAAHVTGACDIPILNTLVSGLTGIKPKVVGVQATYESNSRLHCRYDSHWAIPTFVCPDWWYTKPTKCEVESKHDFGGMTRYISFDIQEDYPFGQTDYVALVNKDPKDAAFKLGDSSKFLGFGGQKQHVGWAGKDARVIGKRDSRTWSSVAEVSDDFDGKDPGQDQLLEGLNGWARGQAYYHRPGFWAEPPNFFNPFWKARLAPIAPVITQFTGKIPALGGATKSLVEKAITH